MAGGKGANLFSRSALKRIHSYSGGLPRLINVACDRALLAGYTRDAARIDRRIGSAGIRDLRQNRTAPSRIRPSLLIPALVIVLAVFASAVYVAWQGFILPFKASPPAVATEAQPKMETAPTGEAFTRLIAAELGAVSEADSAREAFNVLAGLWKVPPVAGSAAWDPANGMERAAAERKLRLYRFSGNLGALSRINCPAALELNLPGVPGSRFVALVSLDQDRLAVDPPLGGRKSILFHELERHWSGKGFLLWRDFFDLQGKVKPGSTEESVRQLQGLLGAAGTYNDSPTGVYDSGTLAAVRAFQFSRGLQQDGLAGGQTLMSLYAAVDRFTMPRLGTGRK